MRKVTSCLSVIALSLATTAGAAFGQATIQIGSIELSAGQAGSVDVRILTNGNDVAGTENEILFGDLQLDRAGVIRACRINPDIMREASAFSFSPSGCTVGTDCESLKALVLSFSNLNPLADGVVLYTCDVEVPAGTAPGEYELTCANPGASDPAGNSVDAVCGNGTVTVPDQPVANISVGSATGAPGGTAQIEISLNLLEPGTEVAGSENVLSFGPEAQIVGCTFNPEIGREASATSFSPSGCTPGTDCTSVKALVLSFSNLTGIPDGSVLYTCDVGLAGGSAAAVGTFPITCSDAGASDPNGNPLTTTCTDGSVTIEEMATPTPQPTSTAIPPTATVSEATNTPEQPTAVPATATTRPTNTPSRVDDDSCAIVAPQSTSTGWMLLLPMAGLLWLRRRNR